MIETLDARDLVLTANRRLAADVRGRFDAHQVALGHRAWVGVECLPLRAWVQSRFVALCVLPEVLLRVLWQEIILHDEASQSLICAAQAAQNAQAAWRLLVEWDVSDAQLQSYDHDGLAAFRGWRDRYLLAQSQALFTDQPGMLCAADVTQLTPLPQRVHCVGFEQQSPLISKLFDTLHETCEIIEWLPTTQQASVLVQRAQDLPTEFAMMVDWACAQGDRSVACIVPEINTHYHTLRELFEARDVHANIAAAIPLSHYPIVASAQQVLQCVLGDAEPQQHASLVNSPFIGQLPKPRTLKPQSPRTWVNLMISILQEAQWPGARQLNSSEYQAKARFEHALTEFARLELVLERLDQASALRYWLQVVEQTVFLPQNAHSTIQVLGLLEATGLHFDAIWLQGMTDETLPQPIQPNPFLPVQLQRELSMPRANPQHELTYAQRLIDRLRRSCSECIVSYSAFDGDRPQAISPLFKDFPISEATLPRSECSWQPGQLESLQDDHGPIVRQDERIRGGSGLIKAQSACPFQAFARYRLHTEPLPEPQYGIDPAERGIWVHEALQGLWSELTSHTDLLAADIESLLDRHIESAARHLPNLAAYSIEKERLKRVLRKWLRYEQTRAPFSVHTLEGDQTLTIGGLSIQLRMDRIDVLPDGSYLLIDYKTGKANCKDWFGPRPADPQLPLYCLANAEISHVCFAKVRLSDHGFSGISITPEAIVDTQPVTKYADDWPSLRAHWHQSLNELALAFMNGDARVAPRDNQVCQYCHCQPLCRIFEHGHR